MDSRLHSPRRFVRASRQLRAPRLGTPATRPGSPRRVQVPREFRDKRFLLRQLTAATLRVEPARGQSSGGEPQASPVPTDREAVVAGGSDDAMHSKRPLSARGRVRFGPKVLNEARRTRCEERQKTVDRLVHTELVIHTTRVRFGGTSDGYRSRTL